MTDPAIITVDNAALNGIIQTGKPAGLWMAQSTAFPKSWTGVDSRPGHLCLMKHGTFPEVLDWLMLRGGIMKRGEQVEIRNPSREREWRGARTSSLPVRIEGAEVKEWKEEPGGEQSFAGAPVHEIGQEMLKGCRQRCASKTDGQDGKIAAQRGQAAVKTRDAEILKLALSGMMWKQIAEKLGVSAKVVSHRINIMRMKGYHIPNKAKLEAEARSREQDERVIALVNAGLRLSAIARETGEQKRAVSRRLARLRQEGRIV